MSLSCPDVRVRFGAYASDSLEGADRRAVREHLASCAGCREEAAAFDPLLLFATVRPVPESSPEAEQILSAVRTGILLKTAERKLAAPSRRRRVGALASAAAAVALTVLGPGAPARRDAAAVPERAAAKATFHPAARPAPAAEGFEKVGGRQKFPADATIYDWNPGAGEPRVVWIVDRSIDI
jgi:anti-sigma factor RsiW